MYLFYSMITEAVIRSVVWERRVFGKCTKQKTVLRKMRKTYSEKNWTGIKKYKLMQKREYNQMSSEQQLR